MRWHDSEATILQDDNELNCREFGLQSAIRGAEA